MSAASPIAALTASQNAVVFCTGSNLLVGAGAGSGKTTTVVRAICYRLGATMPDESGVLRTIEDPMALSDIAAITFTNRAAADLKRKLREGLQQCGLAHVAMDVDVARIGTIHAFCGDVLRDFSLRAGISPSVQLLDEGESRALTERCAERAVIAVATEQSAEWLAPLMSGRRLRDVTDDVVRLASDTDLLSHYARHSASMRLHEQRLLAIAERAAAFKRERLDEQGVYDFGRIIVATRDLLRDHADVRHAVQRQIKLLIVDEFQDVDPAQRDLALLLSGLDTEQTPATQLLLVGDPKQSIFRFRRADVTLWNAVVDRFTASPADGQVIALTENFRSRQGILAFVDRVIGPLLELPIADDGVRRPSEVPYAPLEAKSAHADGDACVELMYVPPQDDKKVYNAKDVRAFDAAAVAQRVRELVAGGTPYREIALVFISWKAVPEYERALRDVGIPVYALRSDGFWETREMLDCLLALRAIRDGGDVVMDAAALVGFLKSPFVGVRDETLFALAQHPGGWHAALREEPRERDLLVRAVAFLERFQALRDRIPLASLVQRMVTDSGFLASLAHDPERGAQAQANVRKLLRLAAGAQALTLGEWLRDIALARSRGDEVAQERLHGEGADVVTLTSVHSAKGLEWRVVLWCDLVHSMPSTHDALQLGRDGFSLKDIASTDEEGKTLDPEYDALQRELQIERRAELYRLWYVAATRPKELLILTGVPLGTSPSRDVSVAGHLRTHFSEQLVAGATELSYAHADGTAFRMVMRAIPLLLNTSTDGPAEVDGPVMLAAPPEPLTVAIGRSRLSASQLMVFAHSPDAWRDRYLLGEGQFALQAASAGFSGSSAIMGTIVHDVLEHFQFDVSDIDELIEHAIARHGDPEERGTTDRARFRQRIHDLLDTAVDHEAWRSLVSHVSARRELTFTRLLPGGTVIEGAFDAAAVVDGSTTILDVKTGAPTGSSTAAEQYAMQAATYVEAAQAIAGRPAHFALLHVRSGEVTPVSADVAAVQEVVAQLRG